MALDPDESTINSEMVHSDWCINGFIIVVYDIFIESSVGIFCPKYS